MKVAFFTLGCRTNQYETNAMIQKFLDRDYEIVPNTEIADVYVINTCSVTGESDKKSRKFINKANRLNPDAVIAVVGCYSQMFKDEVKIIEGVDVVAGTANKDIICDLVEKAFLGKKVDAVDDISIQKEYNELGIVNFIDRVRAFVKIEDGCNNCCTYCLITYARGVARSRRLENILHEVKNLVKKGVKEIIFTGINLSYYGKDLENVTLVDVVNEVSKFEGVERIRFGSVYPEMFTDEFLKCIKNNPKVCPHFHISLQSGCDETLKRMGRKYTISEYDEILKKIIKIMPTASITTDIIVGFPGETDEEYMKTYNYLKNSSINKFHVFPYSKREGTVASKMENQVPDVVKDERTIDLIKLSNRKEQDFYNKFVGKKMDVLFEQKLKNGFFEGHTENFLVVKRRFDKNVKGDIIEVTI